MAEKVRKIEIPQKFKPLLDQKHEYYIFHSGRGCGKSVNIIICLILLATQQEMRILCVREIMNSLSESVKATIEEWIEKLGVSAFFEITRDEIRCKNGSVFLFRGLQSTRAVNIKSISNIRITFVEEAEAISEASWDLLVPSVMRRKEKDCSIICALNPRYEEDVIAQRFLLTPPPPKSYVCKLETSDNPFFYETQLHSQMQHDEKTLSRATFEHKWLGKFISASDDCLFNDEALKLMKEAPAYFERSDYVSVAIGIDPATTNKDFSNKYGIVVVGAHKSGEYHMLENGSKHATPHEFSKTTNELYLKYQCDCAVVETNQGGDFIKATLLSVNPFMKVEEVRATQDKVKRALPVANLAALGKVKLFDIGRNELLRECKNTTIRGYMGAAGESPDQLDALCWAIYHLGKLRDMNEVESVFSQKQFIIAQNATSFQISLPSQYFCMVLGKNVFLMRFCVKEAQSTEKCIFAEKCEVFEINDGIEKIKSINERIFINYCDLSAGIKIANGSFFEVGNEKQDDLVKVTLAKLPQINICLDLCEDSEYQSFRGNILKNELFKFRFGDKDENLFVVSFCRFILEIV